MLKRLSLLALLGIVAFGITGYSSSVIKLEYVRLETASQGWSSFENSDGEINYKFSSDGVSVVVPRDIGWPAPGEPDHVTVKGLLISLPRDYIPFTMIVLVKSPNDTALIDLSAVRLLLPDGTLQELRSYQWCKKQGAKECFLKFDPLPVKANTVYIDLGIKVGGKSIPLPRLEYRRQAGYRSYPPSSR